MPFPEKIKLEVKKKAAFRCCRCQAIGVEVHHIIPEHEGGTDDAANAAPLCAKCHSDFGDNEQKHKEIREMRDWWYEKAESMFKSAPDYAPILQGIDSAVLEIQQHHTTSMDNLKAALSEFVKKDFEYSMKRIDSITPVTVQTDSSSIVSSSPILIAVSVHERAVATDSYTATVSRPCVKCGNQFVVKENEKECPQCISG